MQNNSVQSLLDSIDNYGLSKSNIEKLMEESTKQNLSPEFLTKLIVENINIYTDYTTMIEFLPKIWLPTNSSPFLLSYLGALIHRLLYLVREYPVAKSVPEYLSQEVSEIHSLFCNFRDSCLEIDDTKHRGETTNIASISDLLVFIKDYPKVRSKVFESLQIVATLFHQFIFFENQKIRTIEEYALIISRSTILWKFGALQEKHLEEILRKSTFTPKKPANIEKFEEILALEFQSYQFLQIGIDQEIVKAIVSTLIKK